MRIHFIFLPKIYQKLPSGYNSMIHPRVSQAYIDLFKIKTYATYRLCPTFYITSILLLFIYHFGSFLSHQMFSTNGKRPWLTLVMYQTLSLAKQLSTLINIQYIYIYIFIVFNNFLYFYIHIYFSSSFSRTGRVNTNFHLSSSPSRLTDRYTEYQKFLYMLSKPDII